MSTAIDCNDKLCKIYIPLCLPLIYYNFTGFKTFRKKSSGYRARQRILTLKTWSMKRKKIDEMDLTKNKNLSSAWDPVKRMNRQATH